MRPQFTVVIENYQNPTASNREISYDANTLTVVALPDDRSYGLLFLCSGAPMIVPARYVKEVRFAPSGASWCPTCDHPLPGFLPVSGEGG